MRIGGNVAAVSERAIRIVFAGLAAANLVLAVWLFFFPHAFFTTAGAFGPYNRHYERDVATFYIAFALGSWAAVRLSSWRLPVLAMTTLQYVTHAINHGIDVNSANNSWAGPFDLASLALAAVQLAVLLWLLLRSERPSWATSGASRGRRRP